MAQRIGISEAPKSEISVEPDSKYLPVAEVANGGRVIAGSTTIEDLAQYISSRSEGITQVTRLRLDDATTPSLQLIAFTAPNIVLPAIRIFFGESGRETLIGDDEAIVSDAGTIVVRDPGVYQFEYSYWAEYTKLNQGDTERWQNITFVLNGTTGRSVGGTFWGTRVTTGLFRIHMQATTFTLAIGEDRNISSFYSVRNASTQTQGSPSPGALYGQLRPYTGANTEASSVVVTRLGALSSQQEDLLDAQKGKEKARIEDVIKDLNQEIKEV